MLFGLAGISLLLFALVPMLHHARFLVGPQTLFIGAGLGSTMPAAQTMVQWAAGNQELGETTAVLSFREALAAFSLFLCASDFIRISSCPIECCFSRSPRHTFAWQDSRNVIVLAQRSECGAEFQRERLRRLPCGEVSALIDLVEVDQGG
jgi:hypothetical protein